MISAELTNKKRKQIYRRDGFVCALCGYGETLQIHHVVRRGEGGGNTDMNLITLCSKCHQAVHGYDVWVDISQEEAIQLCVEYVADWYTTEERVWNPYTDKWVL